MFKKYLMIFLVSMVPLIELRVAVPMGLGMGLNTLLTYIVCIIGNMLPIPFILLFIKQIFKFMKKHNILVKFIEKLERKTEKNADKVLRYKQWGLLAFVAIPLPGTGGWTGSLFASLLNIEFKKALPIVALGVFIANLIMGIISFGLLGF